LSLGVRSGARQASPPGLSQSDNPGQVRTFEPRRRPEEQGAAPVGGPADSRSPTRGPGAGLGRSPGPRPCQVREAHRTHRFAGFRSQAIANYPAISGWLGRHGLLISQAPSRPPKVGLRCNANHHACPCGTEFLSRSRSARVSYAPSPSLPFSADGHRHGFVAIVRRLKGVGAGSRIALLIIAIPALQAAARDNTRHRSIRWRRFTRKGKTLRRSSSGFWLSPLDLSTDDESTPPGS
jgi:hypothetical protein